MTDLTKQENKIAIPEAFKGFTEEEALGGMNPIQEGYLKSYKYFLSRPTTKGKFQIVNNDTQDIVWEGSEIKGAVIYYGHEVLRLKKGLVESPEKNEADYTDEEAEILAVTFDPQNSKGNFESNGYGRYLTKEFDHLQNKMRRLYVVMILPNPEYKTGLELVAASFSITTIKSFNSLRKSIRGYGMLPLPLVRSRLFFTESKSESGQLYDRVDFELETDGKGNLSYVHKSREDWLSSPRGKSLLDKIIETHKGAVENAERSGGVEREVISGESSVSMDEAAEIVKDKFHGTVVDDSDLPF
jgi:hypothetical protein